jgi:hypothetical protein
MGQARATVHKEGLVGWRGAVAEWGQRQPRALMGGPLALIPTPPHLAQWAGGWRSQTGDALLVQCKAEERSRRLSDGGLREMKRPRWRRQGWDKTGHRPLGRPRSDAAAADWRFANEYYWAC